MFKRSARYFTLALTFVALTATTRSAAAQPDDPCSDPTVTCVVGGTDPQPPTSKAVTADPTTFDSDSADNTTSLDDLISYLIVLYGPA